MIFSMEPYWNHYGMTPEAHPQRRITDLLPADAIELLIG
jgi:hypothetical protein